MEYKTAEQYIQDNARYLEKQIYHHYFISPCADKVVKALSMYQNKDGGYGNGLEPDFRLPNSSPMATSVALRLLSEFKNEPLAFDQIEKAISYLENTYLPEKNGWEKTGKLVNLFPHAPWWQYGDVDLNFDFNPSAELLGYLIEFRQYVKHLDVELLTKIYIEQYLAKDDIEVHQFYCILRLNKKLSDIEQALLINKLKSDYQNLVCVVPSEWNGYVPMPVNFLLDDKDNILEVSEELINANMMYLKGVLLDYGVIAPNWSWNAFPEDWEIAKREWTGILTLDYLRLMSRFVK